jgi:hypothetical protein
MRGQPLPDRAPAVTGEIVGDEVKIPLRIGVVKGLEQRQIAGGVAGRSGLGQRLPIPDAERPIDPDFLRPALVVQGHFDAVAIPRPARDWWEVPRSHWPEFVDAEDGRLRRRCSVERDEPRPFGTKSGSLLFAHSRVRRQRIPSCRKIRRT